jgi:hypothetical protein
MTETHRAAEHHIKAAAHHMQASRYHRESSRHYEIGKDYAHAAHQALVAHGHALRALRSGNDARLHYATHHLSNVTRAADPVAPAVRAPLEIVGSAPAALSAAEHHAAAATHHEQAARHHTEAARLAGNEKDAAAGHEAQTAHRHVHYSVFHDDEAAMHHVEHYGKSGQSAEIA